MQLKHLQLLLKGLRFTIVSLFLFVSIDSMAALSPRMYSIMAQASGTIKDSGSWGNSSSTKYNNKIDLEVLYLVRGGPTFGARYLIENRNDSGTSEAGEGYGPCAGYYWEKGFYLLINYDILAKLGYWRNGEGFQFDLGYLEHIGNKYHIGFKYSSRNITYKTDLTDNTKESRNIKDTFPSFVFMYLF